MEIIHHHGNNKDQYGKHNQHCWRDHQLGCLHFVVIGITGGSTS
jgi:hypothetical protein